MRLRMAHVAHGNLGALIGVREDDLLVYLAVFAPDRHREVQQRLRHLKQSGYTLEERPRACADVRRQVANYLRAAQTEVDVPFELEGTPFQHKVWNAVRRVRWGRTIGYAELARRIGQPTAIRAVARANAQNPLALVVPCHRVVGVGSRPGTPWKGALLELERPAAAPR